MKRTRVAVVAGLAAAGVLAGATPALASYSAPKKITADRCIRAETATNSSGTFGLVTCWNAAGTSARLRYLSGSGTVFHTYATPYQGKVRAVADDGRRTFAIIQPDGTTERLYLVKFTHSGASTTLRRLHECAAGSCFGGAGLMASNDRWWAVWSVVNDTDSADLWEAKTWGTDLRSHKIRTGLINYQPSIARNPGGGAVIAFKQTTNWADGSIYLGRTRDKTWTFGKLKSGGFHPKVASYGATTMVGYSLSDCARCLNTTAYLDNHSGSWQGHTFSVKWLFGQRTAQTPMIAVSQGKVVLGWTRTTSGSNTTAYVAKKSLGGTWSFTTLTSSHDQELAALGSAGGRASALLSVLNSTPTDGGDAYIAVRREL
jgi:hypothetical protein